MRLSSVVQLLRPRLTRATKLKAPVSDVAAASALCRSGRERAVRDSTTEREPAAAFCPSVGSLPSMDAKLALPGVYGGAAVEAPSGRGAKGVIEAAAGDSDLRARRDVDPRNWRPYRLRRHP